MQRLIGLIPAAGKGVRARPYTTLVPKGMLRVNGVPLLERTVCTMRDQLNISTIYMTIGYLGEIIREYFGDGSRFRVRLHYVENNELDKGLAWSVLLAGKKMNAPCCVMLSDECYIDTDHSGLLTFPYNDALVTCTVMQADDVRLIQRNYAVEKEGRVILRLLEKPERPPNNLLGLGTFVLTPQLFPLLEDAFARSENGYVEFVTFIDGLCGSNGLVLCYEMDGQYVNINDRDSLNLAGYLERNRSFIKNRVSLLLYSEGVEEKIACCINRYRRNQAVDDTYVVLPEKNEIQEAVQETNAKIITVPDHLVLYGERIAYALDRMEGDIFILSEAYYTFPEHDINKLLEYMKEADMVLGTRTTRQLIEQGSDMRTIVREANIFLAKMLELFWWRREVRLSDVGCTFRAIWRYCYEEVRERIHGRGPEFLAEMVVEVLEDRKRIIEIPVNYFNRNPALAAKYRNRTTFLRILMMLVRKQITRNYSSGKLRKMHKNIDTSGERFLP